MSALTFLPELAGRWFLRWLHGTGIVGLVLIRTLRQLFHLNRREYMRGLLHFGWDSLGIALWVAVVIGAMVVVQSGLYVNRFGARLFLGWAAAFAVIWEFGPLLLGLVMAARVGARNAAELSSLQTGGQLEGLRGISLDPFAVLVAPRVLAIVTSMGCLAMLTFVVAIAIEIIAAYFTLGLPIRVFRESVAASLGWQDAVAGLIKTLFFGLAIATVSTAVGMRAHGGARAVGRTAGAAVVWAALSIFSLDLLLTPILARMLAR
ncbi:MAG: MlaE family ABC transporter permease [Myxococcaceae bacterium]